MSQAETPTMPSRTRCPRMAAMSRSTRLKREGRVYVSWCGLRIIKCLSLTMADDGSVSPAVKLDARPTGPGISPSTIAPGQAVCYVSFEVKGDGHPVVPLVSSAELVTFSRAGLLT